MAFSGDTIAALATPVGTSALAVVRASGPGVAALVRAIFAELPPPRTARHADYRDVRGTLVDDVLYTFFAAPNSFTGEDTLEISCHGNPFIARRIIEDLLGRGCRSAEAGEFSKRAFLNGRMDLSQAEAVMDLIHARSERALAAANQQLRGALGRQVGSLISQLISILARIEAYLDFPDDDLPVEDRDKLLKEIEELIAGTKRLRATAHGGELLREGIKAVILGEPNAGKSSLLNRLVGRDRVLVSPEPGTTRDFIEERVAIGTHWFRLIDTAGLNSEPSPLEKRGIEKTLEQAESADLFLWVLDSSRPLSDLPVAVSRRMTPSNTIAIQNKVDLAPLSVAFQPSPFTTIQISALLGTGISELRFKITQMADALLPTVGSEAIAINARHSQALAEALDCLQLASNKMHEDESGELIASDLRGVLDAFGQILGKIDNEKVLDHLFASFCIGK